MGRRKRSAPPTVTATDALERLREGNERFVTDQGGFDGMSVRAARQTLEGQAPFAVILGCSDSRVPAEVVFDQGFGELFVIRVAGNIVAPSQAGSVEFAVEQLGARLVVVLGHTRCGAVLATIDAVKRPAPGGSPNLGAIVERIRPCVEALVEADSDDDRLVDLAVRANIRASIDRLAAESAVVRRMIREDGLVVVGAEYSLETGRVEFLDGAATDSTDAPVAVG